MNLYDAALEESVRFGEERRRVYALGGLAWAKSELGDLEAVSLFEMMFSLAKKYNDQAAAIFALNGLGVAVYRSGDPKRAVCYHRKQLSEARALGDLQFQAAAYGGLANRYLALDRPEGTIRFASKALDIVRRGHAGVRKHEGNALRTRGCAFAKLRRWEDAAKDWDEGFNIAIEIDDRDGMANALWNRAHLGEQVEGLERSVHCAQAALKLYTELESPMAAEVRDWLHERGADIHARS